MRRPSIPFNRPQVRVSRLVGRSRHVTSSSAGQKYGHVLDGEAPGRQGATRAQSRSHVTEEMQRSRTGCIGSQNVAGILTGGTRLRYTLVGVTAVLCGVMLVSTRQVWAETTGSFSLTWAAPEECPSPSQVQAEIARLVGGDIQLHEGDLEARVMVSHGPLWSGDLTTQHAGQTGHRIIDAPSCRAVADAIALIVALLIDPDAVAANAQAPERKAPSIPEPSKSNEPGWEFWAGVHAQARVGTLPDADIGIGLALEFASPRWHTDLRWSYGLRRDQVASLPSGASGRFNILMGSVTECFNVGQAEWGWGPCAAVEAGRVSVRGYGATAGFSRQALWLALGGGAFLSRAMGQHLRVLMELDVVAPMYRPDYVFQDIPGVVFKAPAVGGRALADISWHF
jgi:hypothetical protein